MKVLVSAASRHGATGEIATAIARHLADAGLEAAAVEPDDVTALSDEDAVVLGSAVYAGHWLDPATQLVARLGSRLSLLPVWLFSSGPIGDPPKPEEDPVDVVAIMEATGAREHHVFSGCIDRSRLTFPERALVRALRVPVGDYRDWDDVAAWSAHIVEELRAV